MHMPIQTRNCVINKNWDGPPKLALIHLPYKLPLGESLIGQQGVSIICTACRGGFSASAKERKAAKGRTVALAIRIFASAGDVEH